MGILTPLLLFACISSLFHTSNGCSIEGLDLWGIPVAETILDTYSGIVLNRSISNIDPMNVDHGTRLNGGPYVEVELTNSRLLIWTNNLYPEYERHETLDSMSITITFSCSNGETRNLVVIINVEDTNNNAPVFIPNEELEFTIATPVPPGFLVTGCNDGITVEDIDLTTQRIDFSIEENPFFEIAYDSSLSTRPKEFKAVLRTKTLIRTIPEPITLRISATDVDNTGDPAITTYTTIQLKSDTEFEYPEEPVFSQTFYMATYSRDNQFTHEPISLRQGFDDSVQFDLDGDHANNFELFANGNEVSIRVRQPLPADILLQHQILLIVTAERTYTSGASSTVIVQLPEVIQLEFERAHYNGIIVDNTLQLSQLRLSQVYEGLITASITSDHSPYFNTTVEGNTITITMSPLSENVILDNNFIYLQVVASTDYSVASTIVTLEIVKDDYITPVFERALYTGTYNPSTGLVIEPIVIVNGFDETVDFNLEGEYVHLFDFIQNGSNIQLTSSTLPSEMYSEQQILLTLKATKPRTVGASSAIVISLPEARILYFEELSYKGSLREDVLALDDIILSDGYDDGVYFNISGEHANYFEVSNVRNQVNLNLSRPLAESIITDNSFIVLTLSARGLNAVPATVTILLEIIKEDVSTPLFSRNVYYATYRGTNEIDIENIFLQQGYDSSVNFRAEGEHSQYFRVSNTGNNVLLSLISEIPLDVIFREKVLYINIVAVKELTVGANSVVLIRFPAELTEPVQMRFSQNTYTGSIINDELSVETIALDVGYENGTTFWLTGDYADDFIISNINNIISISFNNTLPSAINEDNNLFILEIEARRERAVSVWTSVVLEVVRPIIEIPVFSEAFYRGTYEENTGLLFEDKIYLSSGYDDTVKFSIDEEFTSIVTIVQTGGVVTLSIDNSIPTELIENDRILFAMVAKKPNSISGSTAILIEIQKEYTQEMGLLGFEMVTYIGFIENNAVTVDPIVLGEGYTSNVTFSLHGDLASYFRITWVGPTVSIVLQNAIPEALMPANGVIVLEVQASAPGAITAHTTVVLTVVTESELTPIVELVFSAAHYTGSYTEAGGLVFTTPISLSQGYDNTVQFTLEGDDSQWFGILRSQNSVTLTLTNAIPAAIIANNRHLIFSILAQRPGSADAQSTIVIALADEYTQEMGLLGFERVTYVGFIENNAVTVDPIVLGEGYTSNVTFSLHGDLASYFRVTWVGPTVSIVLQNAIPEALMPANGVIVLEVQASAPGAITAHTTIVLTLVTESELTPIVELVFSAAHYTGSYTEAGGLVFTTPISLSQGYDNTVQFTLEGDDSQWFGILRSQNSVTLTLTNAIPAAIIANNRHLIFSILAQRPGSADAQSTIVIALADEYTQEMGLLGFERVTYIGFIENNAVTVDPIVLGEGYTSNVTFSLHGDLASYFRITWVGPTVSIVLQNAIPEALMPANGVIVLEVQASAPGAITAHTTVVLTVVTESELTPIVELVFSAAHYTGSYTEAGGLVFTTPISLSQGYDNTVQFTLEGDDSQWFGILRSQNSVTLTLTNAIPAAIIANNRHLIFSILAQRPGSADAQSTIVIALADEYTQEMGLLGFERVTYVGFIENNAVTVDPIVLGEGYTSNVTFSLHGDLASYFRVTWVGPTVSIVLQNAIPEALMPANGVIVLEVQASAPGAITAHTTIVLTLVTESELTPIVELVFSAAHYTGSYTEAGGLVFTTPISLSQGYDNTVQFTLEGDDSQWFGILRSQNSVTLTLTNAIPAAIIANNRHLIFSILAQRPGSADAQSTIVIALADEYTQEMGLLGFERVTYIGFIENNAVTVDPIVLGEGYTSNVTFSLHGDLASYFRITWVGPTVSIVLQNAIPEALMPANGVIVLEVQASAPGAITAHTTVVLTVVTESELTPIVELVFSAAHYTGSYTEAGGLVFTTPISLSQGYDNTVQFTLEGDDSQWFGILRSQNSVTLTLTNAIPAAIIANNRHLIFSILAQRPGSANAQSTIVIALTDEYTQEMGLLGFERVTYIGFIENNAVTVDPIVLGEGYTSNVTFSLHGDLGSYFRITWVGPTVSIVLQNAIPEALMPANGVIVLEVQASAPGAITAHTTVVLTVVTESELTPIVELVFSAAHYTGSYTEAGGLVFTTAISLSQGYDNTVQFTLEGDDSQWFGLLRSQNSVTLTLINAIPAAIIANNRHLIFSVVAQRPGSANVRATIIVTLNIDIDTELDVRFDRVLYHGIIQNDIVLHETIRLEGHKEHDIEIHGEFSSLFTARISDNEVFVQRLDSGTLPNVNHMALELGISAARAVLVLAVEHSGEDSLLPVVTFSSPSYRLAVDNTQTGFVGRVEASADNGEAVRYSITSNDELTDRLSINDSGEIHLSAPAPSGVHSALVIATTVFTQARAEATVHITVTDTTTCGEDNLVLPPLIIINRDEETAHENLVVLNVTEHLGCHFSLTNRWPTNQTWLYVDEVGLHTEAIDREHESIASMALSQVQVELTLHCDENARTKRSLDARPEWLDHYDYGTSEWVLTDTILYNPRRSFVNLIVNDINDNRPIFDGKENEPIAVGYPISDLVQTVMPRSLVELQATDADVGINAALVYWSTEETISVSPSSGFVHVRDEVRLENNTLLTIHATDQRGQGLSGSIEILVKLLDYENVVVLTVRDAFLDDERNILAELSSVLGYDVKVLRSTVMPDGAEANQDDSSRKHRSLQATGSSLQLYIYGMMEREPVSADRLTADVNNNAIVAVNVASVLSLEDYLEGQEICVIPGRDTGLLVATILLSILLFILIVLMAVWFTLKRREELNNYDQFSDKNSLASRNESLSSQPKLMIAPKPRLNIDEIKKSERRLQDMLQAPVAEEEIRPTTSKKEYPVESIVDMSPVESMAPVVTVIQSIDKLKDATDESDNDEFGEIPTARRKSVVTFNENVEKIIHVEEDDNLSTEPDYEIYKL